MDLRLLLQLHHRFRPIFEVHGMYIARDQFPYLGTINDAQDIIIGNLLSFFFFFLLSFFVFSNCYLIATVREEGFELGPHIKRDRWSCRQAIRLQHSYLSKSYHFKNINMDIVNVLSICNCYFFFSNLAQTYLWLFGQKRIQVIQQLV